jgi:replicative DNA helicase
MASPSSDHAPLYPHGNGTRFVNQEAEAALLGALLIRPSYIEEARGIVTEASFAIERNRIVWRALDALGPDADYVTVAAKVAEWGKSEDVSATFVVSLQNDSYVAEAWRNHAEVLEQLAGWRHLDRVFARALAGLGGEDGPNVYAERVRESLRGVPSALNGDGARIYTDVGTVVDWIGLHRNTADRRGIGFGLPVLDDALGGMQPGQVVVIAGPTGYGKSILIGNLAEQAAAHGCAVLCTNEMLGVDYATRLLAKRARIGQHHFLHGHLTDQEWARLSHHMGEVADLPIYRMEAAFSVDRLQLAIARARADVGPVVWAAFDWIQAIEVSGDRQNRTRELDIAMRQLKRIAVEEKIPVVVAAQFHKLADGIDATLNAIRDSSMIAQLSDNTLFIEPWPTRTLGRAPHHVGKIARVIRILKARMGKPDAQPVWFDGAHALFEPMDPRLLKGNPESDG